MKTIIRINTDSITSDLIAQIKKLFPHTIVEITISPAYEEKDISDNSGISPRVEEGIGTYEKNNEVMTGEQQFEDSEFNDDFDINTKSPIKTSFKSKIEVKEVTRFQPKFFIE